MVYHTHRGFIFGFFKLCGRLISGGGNSGACWPVRDPVGIHDSHEIVVPARHAVDVVAEVEVRVEDVGARRNQTASLAVVQVHELERPGACIHGG